MHASELFNEVKTWLEAEKIKFSIDEEDCEFITRMNIDNGLVGVRLTCEESPAILQAICAFPIKVPKDRVAAAGLFLHGLNARLRMGAFHFDAQERIVQFRVGMPIRINAELPAQFTEAFALALSTVDGAIPPLCLFLCSSKKAKKLVSELSPGKTAGDENLPSPKNRLELN